MSEVDILRAAMLAIYDEARSAKSTSADYARSVGWIIAEAGRAIREAEAAREASRVESVSR